MDIRDFHGHANGPGQGPIAVTSSCYFEVSNKEVKHQHRPKGKKNGDPNADLFFTYRPFELKRDWVMGRRYVARTDGPTSKHPQRASVFFQDVIISVDISSR
ncbi:Uncharacterized protein HZ326_6921 [Fusarium oxysporum f. sp. albedinis]|nr:Uncharacterized protein HZ326_6921 [Fusarium oxysporum f. sp. albedinis]